MGKGVERGRLTSINEDADRRGNCEVSPLLERSYFPTALKPRVTMGEGLKLVANSSSPGRYPVWCGFSETTRWVSSPGFSTFLGWRTIESCESFDFTFRIRSEEHTSEL